MDLQTVRPKLNRRLASRKCQRCRVGVLVANMGRLWNGEEVIIVRCYTCSFALMLLVGGLSVNRTPPAA